MDAELTPTEPIDFDPCAACEEFCHNVCPQDAFDEVVFSPTETGVADNRLGSGHRNILHLCGKDRYDGRI